MASRILESLRRIATTPYTPNADARGFLSRAQTQSGPRAEVTAAVLDASESHAFFGIPLARRGLQAVYLRVANHARCPLRLQLVRIDPNYYTALEVAAANHYSIFRRLTAFGILGHLFLPLLLLVPSKLFTAYRANRRMNEFFREHAFRLRPVAAGEVAEGFVFTPLDAGTKVVHVCLAPAGDLVDSATGAIELHSASDQAGAGDETGSGDAVEFTFSIPVPGLAADYLRRDFATLLPAGSKVACDLPTLVARLSQMPAATTNAKGTRSGDPANLVVIGDFETMLGAFAARWDESETITLASCWRTVKSFLLGSQYRYSPVSPLYLFGRSQDIALQRSRRSINERLHLRLWLTPLEFHGKPVWVGQVSRDIGVRFTTKTWNLTTHRVDPDVDESRDYVLEDLLHAERVDVSGYVAGVGACDRAQPRHNLTGDPYYTDGKRLAIALAPARTAPRFVGWA